MFAFLGTGWTSKTAGRVDRAHDANWNVSSIMNTSGTAQERFIMDPFGSPTFLNANWSVIGSSAFAWTHLHQGGRFSGTASLYHFRNRDLSPNLGRWEKNDPIGYAGDVNLYRFVANSPLNLLDPQGTLHWLVHSSRTKGNYVQPPATWFPNEGWYAAYNCHTSCPLSASKVERAANSAHTEGHRRTRELLPDVAVEDIRHRAIRHCIASGLLARALGCACSWCLGKYRERYQQDADGNQTPAETAQAIANNEHGLRCAGCRPKKGSPVGLHPSTWVNPDKGFPSIDDIVQCCKKLLDDKKLDLDEKPSNSKKD
jgi:RHS repeat-associated protein